MKKLLVIICLTAPLFSIAQAGGFQFGPSILLYKNSDKAYGGEMEGVFNVGKPVGLGMGFKALKFENASSVYMPLYFAFRCNLSDKKAIWYLNLNGGYGIYNDTKKVPLFPTGTATAEETAKGGLYFASGIGVHGNGTSPYLNLGYSFYSFESESKLGTQRQLGKSNLSAFTATVGLWISPKKKLLSK